MTGPAESEDTDLPPGEASPDAPRADGGSVLVGLAGLFALIVGLLLRAAVGGQDRTEWNAAVRTFMNVFPTLLIAGGVVVLLWAAVLTARAGRPPGDGAGGESEPTESD